MTTAKFTTICNGHLNAIIVNGRQTLVSRITEITQTRPHLVAWAHKLGFYWEWQHPGSIVLVD